MEAVFDVLNVVGAAEESRFFYLFVVEINVDFKIVVGDINTTGSDDSGFFVAEAKSVARGVEDKRRQRQYEYKKQDQKETATTLIWE